jgi:CBS domain-containing protein
MKVAGRPTDLDHTAVSQVITVDPVTLPVEPTVAFALNKMLIEGFRYIPLVDNQNRPVGVVSMRDLIDYLSDFFEPEIVDEAAWPGASGSPIHLHNGKVVGMVTQTGDTLPPE